MSRATHEQSHAEIRKKKSEDGRWHAGRASRGGPWALKWKGEISFMGSILDAGGLLRAGEKVERRPTAPPYRKA